MYSFIPTVIDDESCITIGPTGLRRAVSRLESESGYRYLEIDMKNIWRHKADVYFCLLFCERMKWKSAPGLIKEDYEYR